MFPQDVLQGIITKKNFLKFLQDGTAWASEGLFQKPTQVGHIADEPGAWICLEVALQDALSIFKQVAAFGISS